MTMMVTDRAVQILGGHGYIREHPVELWMRNGRGVPTFTGPGDGLGPRGRRRAMIGFEMPEKIQQTVT